MAQKTEDFKDEYSDLIKTARKNGVESDDIKIVVATVKAMRERKRNNKPKNDVKKIKKIRR